MIEQQKSSEQIEQLWYTWSDLGLNTIRAGFRIRAVSPGLSDIRSQRVQNLARYQHYSLPIDANSAIQARYAPVGLSFIVTEQERILVHKVYTGIENEGGYGTFFVHLLANLPADFSVQEAISLWRSPFWQSSDINLRKKDPQNPYSTSLDVISRAHLQPSKEIAPLRAQRSEKIRQYFPYIFQAYLIKKMLEGQKHTQVELHRFYIAGADDDIALLIMGLAQSLPEQFKRNLTFSTYEHDVTKADTEIIGTCWLSGAGGEYEAHTRQLLPLHYYHEKLAFNCYTGEQFQLEQLRLEKMPLLDRIAQYATQYILDGEDRYKALLEMANEREHLDVGTFLTLAERVLNAEKPSKDRFEFVFAPKTSAEQHFSRTLLLLPEYQAALPDTCLSDPEWWNKTLKPALVTLQRQPGFQPTLVRMAYSVISKVQEAIKREIKQALSPEVQAQEEANCLLLLDITWCASPPQPGSPTWRDLLEQLVKIRQVSRFFQKHLPVYNWLMQAWSSVFTAPAPIDENKMLWLYLSQPPRFSWSELGIFLTLQLSPNWNEMAARAFVAHPPRQTVPPDFSQRFHSFFVTLFKQLTPVPQWSRTALNLFDLLVACKYQPRLDLLFPLLDSPLGQHENAIPYLLQMAHLTPQEQIPFLQRYGPRYLLRQSRQADIILEMFGDLEQHGQSQEKMVVLESWLDVLRVKEPLLNILLSLARLNSMESSQFLQRYGETYIVLYPWSSTLLHLFQTAHHITPELRFSLFTTWLNQQVDQLFWEQILQAGNLPPESQANLLERYGVSYLQRYPQSQTLLQYVWNYLERLYITDLSPWKTDPAKNASPTEQLLQFLHASSPQILLPFQLLVQDWCIVGEFVRHPVGPSELAWGKAVESIGRLLKGSTLSEDARKQLFSELAKTCVILIFTADPQAWANMVHTLWNALSFPDLSNLLFTLAESASESIHQKRNGTALFLRCIRFAFAHKTLFQAGANQEFFLHHFLDKLFHEIDQRGLTTLDRASKKWPAEARNDWHRYKDLHPLLPFAQAIPPLQRFQLWHEQTVALIRVRRALKRGDQGRLARVGTEYMTTLLSISRRLPAGCLESIEEACEARSGEQEQQWQPLLALLKPDMPVSRPASRSSTSRMSITQARRKRRKAFRLMRRALKSEIIGRIVSVATDVMPVLDAFYKKISATRWSAIRAACEFYDAFAEASEDTNEDKERAFLQAWETVEACFHKGHLIPRFTAHEHKRREAALRYIQALDAQRGETTRKL